MFHTDLDKRSQMIIFEPLLNTFEMSIIFLTAGK